MEPVESRMSVDRASPLVGETLPKFRVRVSSLSDDNPLDSHRVFRVSFAHDRVSSQLFLRALASFDRAVLTYHSASIRSSYHARCERIFSVSLSIPTRAEPRRLVRKDERIKLRELGSGRSFCSSQPVGIEDPDS